MKEYIEKIVNNGKQEDMECLSDILENSLHSLSKTNKEEYNKFKNKIIGMAYNYTINNELAHDIVDNMKPLGEYWSKEQIINVIGDVPNIDGIYVVMNSLANDYKDVISLDDVDTYVKMTNAWINDEDGHKNKIWWYFVK